LEVEIWKFSGAWRLVLGISDHHPASTFAL
jgi:hypothetical protein